MLSVCAVSEVHGRPDQRFQRHAAPYRTAAAAAAARPRPSRAVTAAGEPAFLRLATAAALEEFCGLRAVKSTCDADDTRR